MKLNSELAKGNTKLEALTEVMKTAKKKMTMGCVCIHRERHVYSAEA